MLHSPMAQWRVVRALDDIETSLPKMVYPDVSRCIQYQHAPRINHVNPGLWHCCWRFHMWLKGYVFMLCAAHIAWCRAAQGGIGLHRNIDKPLISGNGKSTPVDIRKAWRSYWNPWFMARKRRWSTFMMKHCHFFYLCFWLAGGKMPNLDG